MYEILKLYAFLVRKFINRKKNIQKMHSHLKKGYEEYLKLKDKDIIDYTSRKFKIIKIKTKIFTGGEDLVNYIYENLKEEIKENDILTVAESIIGITQNRAYRVDEIKPSRWAYFLYPWVSNVDYGTGLGMAETMECAIREVGLKRILKATLYGFFDRIRKKSGSFYSIAGKQVKSIDFKKNHPIPFKGSNNYIVLSPKDPEKFAKTLYKKFSKNIFVGVVDANNVSIDLLALYPINKSVENIIMNVMKGNPAGQDDEKTPIIIIREI
ncbi:MAG: coenzyme F420-0:L-glutamate ligase [candidate division WOR-3 bacterium]